MAIKRRKSKVWSKAAVAKRKQTIAKKQKRFEANNKVDWKVWEINKIDINTIYEELNRILW